jgi:hypothetical protein
MLTTRRKKVRRFFTQHGGIRGIARVTHKTSAHHDQRQQHHTVREAHHTSQASKHAVGSDKHTYHTKQAQHHANSAASHKNASSKRRESNAAFKTSEKHRADKRKSKAEAKKHKVGSEEHTKHMKDAKESKKKQKDAEELGKQKAKGAKQSAADAKMHTKMKKTLKKNKNAASGKRKMGLPTIIGPIMSALSNAARAIEMAIAAADAAMKELASLAGAFGGSGSGSGSSLVANPAAEQCMSTKAAACSTVRDDFLTKQIGKGGKVIAINVIINADVTQAKCLKKAQESCGVGAKASLPPATPVTILPKKSDAEFMKAWRTAEKTIGFKTPITHKTDYPSINNSVNESIKAAATDEDKQSIYIALALIMDPSNKARYLAMTPD